MRQIDARTGICFFKVQAKSRLFEFLSRVDYSPVAGMSETAEFGCVYVDGRRERDDVELAPGQLVRVHTNPKRYRLADVPVVFEHAEFLVADKPWGLPTHPTLDNFFENTKAVLERRFGTLYTTHRLDIATQGLLIFARTKEAQALINKRFSKGQVLKIYRSLNDASVGEGLYTHYMNPESRIPKQVSVEPREGWWRCELEVQSSEGARHQIRLLTGKTHQIRSQFSALGAPVCGDVTYGARQAYEAIALECFRMEFQFRQEEIRLERPHSIFAEAP